MTQYSDQKVRHRQFLLGNLPEQQAQALEERIFLEPDLAEDLQIEEEELIADYHAGTLSNAERQLFEKKYHSTAANRQLLEYEATFKEFVATKPQAEPLLSVETDRILGVETKPIEPVRAPSWWSSFFSSRRALAYSTAAVAFVLIAVALWYLLLFKSGPSHSAERKAAEAALAALNTPTKIATLGFGAAVELKPVERSGGETVRIEAENVADGLIPFRLNLTEGNAPAYDATFVDANRNEMFTVANVPVRSTSNGPQIWIVVPLQYLTRGDYQIELKATGSETTNSYPFRMTVQN
ncbi:MAG TPA: hypothetical protein VFR12_10745 [Pyrinomonadaceae bacterium]|nr:hypothetical protein [Pyrinomonadaceae bacterium]